MGKFADLVDAIQTVVTSPDRQIQARLENRRVQIRFRPDAYESYRHTDLESQLNRLCAGIWVGYRRDYLAALEEARHGVVHPGPKDPRREAFRAERGRIVAYGMSAGGWLSAESHALTRYQFEMGQEAFDVLDEHMFTEEFSSCVAELLADYLAQVRALKSEHYGRYRPSWAPAPRKR